MKVLVTILLVVVVALCGALIYGNWRFNQLDALVMEDYVALQDTTDFQHKEILSLQKQIAILKKRKPIVIMIVPKNQEAPSDSPSSWTQASNEHIRPR